MPSRSDRTLSLEVPRSYVHRAKLVVTLRLAYSLLKPRGTALLTVLLRDEVEEGAREIIAEAVKRIRQLAFVDGARFVLVKVPEDTLPVRDVLP